MLGPVTNFVVQLKLTSLLDCLNIYFFFFYVQYYFHIYVAFIIL